MSDKITVPLKWQAQGATHGFEFGKPHIARLGKTHAKIGEAECEVVIFGVQLDEQPSAVGIGRKQFHDGHEVRFAALSASSWRLKAKRLPNGTKRAESSDSNTLAPSDSVNSNRSDASVPRHSGRAAKCLNP